MSSLVGLSVMSVHKNSNWTTVGNGQLKSYTLEQISEKLVFFSLQNIKLNIIKHATHAIQHRGVSIQW